MVGDHFFRNTIWKGPLGISMRSPRRDQVLIPPTSFMASSNFSQYMRVQSTSMAPCEEEPRPAVHEPEQVLHPSSAFTAPLDCSSSEKPAGVSTGFPSGVSTRSSTQFPLPPAQPAHKIPITLSNNPRRSLLIEKL